VFHLEIVEKMTIDVKGPRAVIRELANIKIISEDESKNYLLMLDCRNKTSHIYQEETADLIAHQIPEFKNLMCKILERIIIFIRKQNV
jgi:uncharacterized protein YutE (UPF0331/DUF86 family)